MQRTFNYRITGYYEADGVLKYFDREVIATDTVEAISLVVGGIAWQESKVGNTFKLDSAHYEVLRG